MAGGIRFWSSAIVAILAGTGSAAAQTYGSPYLLLVSPPGGKAGSSFEVTVSGQNLEHATGLYFSVAGVRSEYVGDTRTVPIKGAMKNKAVNMRGPRSIKFKVILPPDARPGIHDVRIIAKGGVSNPRAFVVGDLKEFADTEPNDDVPQAQKVELNCTINGVISSPTDVDYFSFTGKKGQRVVLSCLTTSIDSKLPASVEVYSSSGSYLGSGRGYRDNDALLDCILPEDGEYNVRVASFTYTQGGPEYFYRLSISTAPWIDAVFPPVIEPGQAAQITVYGRNIPGGKLDPDVKVDGRPLEKAVMTVKAPAAPLARQRLDFSGFIPPNASGLDGFELRLRNQAGVSNPVLLALAPAPVILDLGNNDSADSAQKVTVPCEIAGRIEKKGDRDWYVFDAKKGDILSIELTGDRLGSPLDMYFTLRDAKGRVLTEQDDTNDVLSPQFFSKSFDPPRYRFVVPADGAYRLMVSSRDAFVQSGPRHAYLLRITPELPDFRIIAMPMTMVLPPQTMLPGSTNLGQHGNQAIQIFVWRQDGFTGDIELRGKDLPAGLSITPQVVTAAQKQGYLVVSAAAGAAAWTGPIHITGTATVHGRKLLREARPASMTWSVPQQNIPAISRLDRSLVVAVRDKAPFTLTASKDRFSASPGSRITVPIKVERHDFKPAIQVTALGLPPALGVQNFALAAGKSEGKAIIDIKNNAAPGTYTVVLNGVAQGGQPKKKKQGLPTGITQPSTPITITVLPKQLAKLSVTPATAKIRPGKETTVLIRVNRLYDFDGPFRIHLVSAKGGGKTIRAEDIAIPAGQSEAKLILTAAASTPTGGQNYVVRATADFQGHAIVQESKITVNVVKAK